jgi:Arc/MetJ-type ribon-helix-helix transcriptional regulator
MRCENKAACGAVPYTKYGNASSFIREGIELLLRREDEQPSGWTAGRPRRG